MSIWVFGYISIPWERTLVFVCNLSPVFSFWCPLSIQNPWCCKIIVYWVINTRIFYFYLIFLDQRVINQVYGWVSGAIPFISSNVFVIMTFINIHRVQPKLSRAIWFFLRLVVNGFGSLFHFSFFFWDSPFRGRALVFIEIFVVVNFFYCDFLNANTKSLFDCFHNGRNPVFDGIYIFIKSDF